MILGCLDVTDGNIFLSSHRLLRIPWNRTFSALCVQALPLRHESDGRMPKLTLPIVLPILLRALGSCKANLLGILALVFEHRSKKEVFCFVENGDCSPR